MADVKQIERALVQKYAALMLDRNATLYAFPVGGETFWFIAPRSAEYNRLITERAKQLRERKERDEVAAGIEYRDRMAL